MKLYHHPASPNARKVLAVASELGLDLEQQIVDLSKGEQRLPGFLAINPNGKVPALVDGDLKLWESHAIMRHLCRSHGDTTLYPADIKAQADIDRWMDWALAHFDGPIATLTYEKMLKPMFGQGDPDPVVVDHQLKRLAPFAEVIDAYLESRTFLVGDGLTLADLAVASSLTYAKAVDLPLDLYPNLKAWYGRVSETKGWSQTEPKFG